MAIQVNYAFSDALIALQEIGRNDIATALMKRWQDVEIDPAVMSFVPEERPPSWVPEFIDMRFSQQEQTDWYKLVTDGLRPDEATTEMKRRRA